MKTDDLIFALSADSTHPARMTQGLALNLGLSLMVCVGLVWGALEFRPDVALSLASPVSALRLVLTLGLMAAGIRLALTLGRPEGQVQVWPLIGIAAVAAAAVVWSLVATPLEGWGMAMQGKTMVWCLISIPTLSVLPVAVLFAALRRGAPTRPGLAGAVAGLAGAGGAAAAYSLHCPEDNPLFYVTWYGLAIGIVAVASSVIGRRVLRW